MIPLHFVIYPKPIIKFYVIFYYKCNCWNESCNADAVCFLKCSNRIFFDTVYVKFKLQTIKHIFFSHYTVKILLRRTHVRTHTYTYNPRILRDECVANACILSNKSGNMANFNEPKTCSLSTSALCAQNRNKTRNMWKQLNFSHGSRNNVTSQKTLQ